MELITQQYILFTTSSLGTNDVKNKLNISISPNPAKDFINIQSDGKINQLKFITFMGKVSTTTQKQINISSLSSGVYLVRIEDDKNNTTTKR